jgi:hypothetical protein
VDRRILIVTFGIIVAGVLYVLFTPAFLGTPPQGNNASVRACNSDGDCGASGYTGLYACKGNSIYGEYAARICVSSGQDSAKCALLSSMELVHTCSGDEECEPGFKDCRLKPNQTTTTLFEVEYVEIPPSSGPTTTLSGVVCVRNSSCGLDHHTKPYCTSSGHSVRDYIAYACLNPGTYASRCVKERTTYLVDYCGYNEACVQGECVDKSLLKWYCMNRGCCDTDISKCTGSVDFLPLPIRGLKNETFTLEHNTTIRP